MSSPRLADKVALVTGSSRGIGAAIAAAMAQEGAKVILCSRKIEGLEAVAEQIRAAGGHALPIACHVGKSEQIEALFERALGEYGRIDVLVNNAATNPYFGPMMNVEEAAWDKTFEVNVKGYFAMSKAVAQHLMGRDAPGSIVNVTSVLGDMAAPLQGVYGMTKAAVISMTRTLSTELGPAGIRVNAIAPGLIKTRFSRGLTENTEIRDMVLDRMSIKRLGEPEDIAGAAVFLGGDESSYVTGHVLTIDGGWTAG